MFFVTTPNPPKNSHDRRHLTWKYYYFYECRNFYRFYQKMQTLNSQHNPSPQIIQKKKKYLGACGHFLCDTAKDWAKMRRKNGFFPELVTVPQQYFLLRELVWWALIPSIKLPEAADCVFPFLFKVKCL